MWDAVATCLRVHPGGSHAQERSNLVGRQEILGYRRVSRLIQGVNTLIHDTHWPGVQGAGPRLVDRPMGRSALAGRAAGGLDARSRSAHYEQRRR
jgi:hypothetical protein